jgi:hypothetical protein
MSSLPDLSDLSTYPIAELLRRWKLGELTAEQAVGHLIQHFILLTHQVTALERRVRQGEGGPAGQE